MSGNGAGTPRASGHDLVIVANRLPVDRCVDEQGRASWATSPGGLVTALEPIVPGRGAAWVGWAGTADEEIAPFHAAGMDLIPVTLSSAEVNDYYEGFANATIWPLYHDVIAPPIYHRTWWQSYRRVNERFAAHAADVAREGSTVWVHDYQLQLVPDMLRARRPDLRIGYFHHVPFPPLALFAQLPWRGQILRGLLGADLVGFQTRRDARSFMHACRESLGLNAKHGSLSVRSIYPDEGTRTVQVREFPISIDSSEVARVAAGAEALAAAADLRQKLGGRKVVLGVDRLDYTKGIPHRLKAYGELLEYGQVDPQTTVLVQVATPSRERVEEYQRLRDDIELTVSRINGTHARIGKVAVVYLHQHHSREEMSALYRLADVLLVTSLRDGMNLVAKEYVASRVDNDGVLVLSEFTGAALELRQALIVNPHDIEGLKEAIVQALTMTPAQARMRMRRLRRYVLDHDVQAWAEDFLSVLAGQRDST